MATFAGTTQKCKACEKTVYLVDQLTADSKVYHKACFRCHHCKGTLKVITIKIESFEHWDTWGTLFWHWSFMVYSALWLFLFDFICMYTCNSLFCHFCTWLWIFLYLVLFKDYDHELIWYLEIFYYVKWVDCVCLVMGSCILMIIVLIVNVNDDCHS